MSEMTEAEGDAWDALWDTDAARCCSCRSCNFYAPDYEQHKGEPCVMRTLIEQIIAIRVTAALNEVAEAILGDDRPVHRLESRNELRARHRAARIVRAAIPTDSAIAGAP